MKPIRYSAALAATASLWLSPATAQLPSPALIVVEDRGGSPTLPYYEAIAPQAETEPKHPGRMLPHRYSEADMLPVRSPSLTPGTVSARSIQAPGMTPLFLIGDDDRSRAWLAQRLADLQRIKAIGLVVNVKTPAALQALRVLAPGLELAPVAADDLAQRLGLSHYPVLITSSGVEQ